MIGKNPLRRGCLSLLLLLVGTHIAFAQPFTRRSSQVQHDGLKKYYEISRLQARRQIRPGRSLEMGKRRRGRHDAGVARRRQAAHRLHRVGTPRRNAAGEIANAVVISSYYSGDSTDMYEQWVKGTALSGTTPIIGPGRPIDTDRYYVVMVDPLGTWGASKPSDGLGIKISAIQLLSTWCRRTIACCATI